MEKIGEGFRMIRREQQITVKDLSVKSGVSRKQISVVENWHFYNMKVQTLFKLATGLGLVISLVLNNNMGVLTNDKDNL